MEKSLVPKGKKGWIQKAVNPEHKGYCTPMTKSTCTPKRKAFAMTMKKHHGFHKRDGGELGDGGSTIPMSRQGGVALAPKYQKKGNLTDKDKYPQGEGKSQKYPGVKEEDFAGSGRRYPIPTREDAEDAMYLAKIHKEQGVINRIKERYPDVKQAGGSLNMKSTIQSGSVNTTKNGIPGFFQGSRTINKYKDGITPNDTIYHYTGQTPTKVENFDYSTGKSTPINQLNLNGRIKPVSQDSIKMFRERVNNLANIFPKHYI